MLPKHVYILGKKFPVKKKKGLSDESGTIAGCVDYQNSTIWINPEQSEYDIFHTLLHEMIHATIWRNGVYQAGLSHELNEILSETIPTAIMENFSLVSE